MSNPRTPSDFNLYIGVSMFILAAACVVVWAAPKVADYVAENRSLAPRQVMKSLEISITAYKTEYLRLPDVATSDRIPVETRGRLFGILLAEIHERNPRRIVFYDLPHHTKKNRGAFKNTAGEWELRDRWGNFYHVLLDMDHDGTIPNPAKGTRRGKPDVLKSDVIIYSSGRDGDFSTWQDNITSWETSSP